MLWVHDARSWSASAHPRSDAAEELARLLEAALQRPYLRLACMSEVPIALVIITDDHRADQAGPVAVLRRAPAARAAHGAGGRGGGARGGAEPSSSWPFIAQTGVDGRLYWPGEPDASAMPVPVFAAPAHVNSHSMAAAGRSVSAPAADGIGGHSPVADARADGGSGGGSAPADGLESAVLWAVAEVLQRRRRAAHALESALLASASAPPLAIPPTWAAPPSGQHGRAQSHWWLPWRPWRERGLRLLPPHPPVARLPLPPCACRHFRQCPSCQLTRQARANCGCAQSRVDLPWSTPWPVLRLLLLAAAAAPARAHGGDDAARCAAQDAVQPRAGVQHAAHSLACALEPTAPASGAPARCAEPAAAAAASTHCSPTPAPPAGSAAACGGSPLGRLSSDLIVLIVRHLNALHWSEYEARVGHVLRRV